MDGWVDDEQVDIMQWLNEDPLPDLQLQNNAPIDLAELPNDDGIVIDPPEPVIDIPNPVQPPPVPPAAPPVPPVPPAEQPVPPVPPAAQPVDANIVDQQHAPLPFDLNVAPVANAVGRRTLLGVTGTPGAQEIPNLLDRLQLDPIQLKVVCTSEALEFVNRHSINVPVYSDQDSSSSWSIHRSILHSDLSSWAEAIAVVPATADIMTNAKLGLCKDLLTTIIKEFHGVVKFIPDMSPGIYSDGLTAECIQELRARGHLVLDPPVTIVERNGQPVNITGRMGNLNTIADWIVG